MPKKPPKKRSRLNGARTRNTRRLEPFWRGPEKDGVTQSMIGNWMACQERFRIRSIEGKGALEEFNTPIFFGHIWHIAEEYFAANKDWRKAILKYAQKKTSETRNNGPKISKLYNVCLLAFPIYIDYWKDHKEVKNRKPLYQETNFRVAYTLPSGRIIWLRGKWDSVDYIGKKVYLQENKTKTTVDVNKLQNQLTNDLQVMTYLTALQTELGDKPVAGVRYNVIRRPLGGGLGSIRPHKGSTNKPAETMDHFYERLAGIIEDKSDTFFFRWTVDIDKKDIERFQNRTLNPILENMADDHEWWSYALKHRIDHFDSVKRNSQFKDHCHRHYLHPFGCYNRVDQAGSTPLDGFLENGSTLGLGNIKSLFPELEDE